MENYQEKARENFYRNRPYGIHIDYARKGFVLFNHYTNSLGKQETGSIEGLPLEKFEDVDAIPLNGKIIKNGNQTTDIYFYTDDSNPYKNMYNPQIEMFAHFKTKSSFHKTKGII